MPLSATVIGLYHIILKYTQYYMICMNMTSKISNSNIIHVTVATNAMSILCNKATGNLNSYREKPAVRMTDGLSLQHDCH